MNSKEIDKLKLRLAGGRITRRDFVRSAVSLGVVLPVATSLSNTVLAATPNKGGTLRQALTGVLPVTVWTRPRSWTRT
ncbi:MAG: hypothetical protein CM1200mP20_05520 [Pseudomonadota bacterium]|nr:MAG: hypothetical protein CM1200mP20_05520 [Pseudomonadota bacterium]GIT54306.1 MAG: hypothetical protein Ct9H300mP16_14660 [Pseudomonadota bacterium]